MRRLVFVSHIPVQAVSAVPCQVLRAILISLASCEFLAFSIFSTSFYKIERSVKSGGAYLCPAIVLIDSAFPKNAESVSLPRFGFYYNLPGLLHQTSEPDFLSSP